MTTSDGAKPNNGDKRKKKPAEPRHSERAYLLDLGTSLDDAETTRAKKGFSIPLKLGNDLNTSVGRESERTRRHFMGWLRQQRARGDEVGMLAEALCTHDASLEDGEEPAGSWVQLLSRIARGQDHPLPSRRGRVARRSRASRERVQRHDPPARARSGEGPGRICRGGRDEQTP